MIEILSRSSETCLAVHFIGWLTRCFGPFTRTEENHFPAGEFEAAFEWACA
jgi:hypothetical protein